MNFDKFCLTSTFRSCLCPRPQQLWERVRRFFISRIIFFKRVCINKRCSITISHAIQGSGGYSRNYYPTQVVILEVYLGLAWATGACVFGCIVVQVDGGPSDIVDIEEIRLMLMMCYARFLHPVDQL